MRVLREDDLRWVAGGLPASGTDGQTETENGCTYVWSNGAGWVCVADSPESTADYYDIDVKPGADIENLSDEMTGTFDTIRDAWDLFAGFDPTITSGNDSDHMEGSLHYSDDAIDLRTTAAGLTSGQIDDIADYLQTNLGGDYDVVVEGNHIHVEYDPN